MGEHFFEGAEKLLEVWFTSTTEDSDDETKTPVVHRSRNTLRDIPRHELERLVELANCRIISTISGATTDAYLLSESSMFVSDHRFILKTCGQTSLLFALEPLISLAARYCDLDYVDNIFYSRKNFRKPELQPSVHQQFEHEIDLMDEMFDEGGAAYCLGRLNQDRWYLYTLDVPRFEGRAVGPAGPLAALSKHQDQTLEILMWELDPIATACFWAGDGRTGASVTRESGIVDLVPPGTVVDDFLFEPCGYSMNALVPESDVYFTMHITPEAAFSYASLETNIDLSEHYDILMKTLEIFMPGKFLITLFQNEAGEQAGGGRIGLLGKGGGPKGYRQTDAQFLKLSHYSLTYAHFAAVGNCRGVRGLGSRARNCSSSEDDGSSSSGYEEEPGN